MQIKITNGHIPLTDELKSHIEQRLGLALGRFAPRIRVATVGFSVVAIDGADPQVRCRIELQLKKKFSVAAIHADVFTAVVTASENAARRIARILEQEIDA
jgi:ribosome-associated translation inhibitor RaiA